MPVSDRSSAREPAGDRPGTGAPADRSTRARLPIGAIPPGASPSGGVRSGPRTKTNGGPPPFQRFLDAHREDVWRFLVASVGRNDADDCFQETFIAALRAYPRLRPNSNLRAWILTIAHRKALDTHRARARRALPVAEIADLAGADNGTGRGTGRGGREGRGAGRSRAGSALAPSPAAPSRARDGELWRAVHELPDRQRAAVVLRFLADLPHRDIAATIGCSEEAARRSLHEGLTTLRREVTT